MAAEEAKSIKILTDEELSKNLALLTEAALRGDANNAMAKAARAARDGEIGVVSASSGNEAVVLASKSTMDNWFPGQKKLFDEGKSPSAEKVNQLGIIKSFMDGDWLGALSAIFLKDKISVAWDTAKDVFSGLDIKTAWAKNSQEHKIRNFAERHGIDGDRLIADLRELPPETVKLAQTTPEEQLKRLNEAQLAREEAAKKAAEIAQQAEVDKAVKLAEAVEAAKARAAQEKEKQATKKDGKEGDVADAGHAHEKAEKAPEKKGKKTMAEMGAAGELNGIASEVSNAGHGNKPTPATPVISGGWLQI